VATTSTQSKHPKHRYMTGVYSHAVPPKKSRKGENIRVCVCADCKDKDLDDIIENKCPHCGRYVVVKSIKNEKGHLIGEICPVCESRSKSTRYFKYFYGVECPKCVATKKVVEAIEKKGVPIEKYSDDNADDMAEASINAVQALPTLMLFEGGKRVGYWTGDIILADVVAVLGK